MVIDRSVPDGSLGGQAPALAHFAPVPLFLVSVPCGVDQLWSRDLVTVQVTGDV